MMAKRRKAFRRAALRLSAAALLQCHAMVIITNGLQGAGRLLTFRFYAYFFTSAVISSASASTVGRSSGWSS